MDEYEAIKKRFAEYEAEAQESDLGVDVGLFGAALGILTRACLTKERRHLLQVNLTGHEHSAALTEAQKYALLKFVSPTKSEETGKWVPELGARFYRNVEVVLNHKRDAA